LQYQNRILLTAKGFISSIQTEGFVFINKERKPKSKAINYRAEKFHATLNVSISNTRFHKRPNTML
jgi:hypothetical protein